MDDRYAAVQLALRRLRLGTEEDRLRALEMILFLDATVSYAMFFVLCDNWF